eukprot:TRINITY_DN26658_c0_g1_i1.p1 TRINITY_DN26658_c0_g1~~TRINITY_DN26658_c0_g1_i1.p1  ORF type:complete len:219 (+),score=15.52 TRINITY_DN26658_c0_g1_i1:75-731(+)
MSSFVALMTLLLRCLALTYGLGRLCSATDVNGDVRWFIDDKAGAFKSHKEEGKPLLTLFYSRTCPVCRKLNESVTPPEHGASLLEASEHYIMLLVIDTDAEFDQSWAPDGSYTPRAMFARDGVPDPHMMNKLGRRADNKYLYTYTTEADLVDSMRRFSHKHYAASLNALKISEHDTLPSGGVAQARNTAFMPKRSLKRQPVMDELPASQDPCASGHRC